MHVCDLCGSSEFMNYCDLEGKTKRSVFICKKCSLTYLYPIPSVDELNDFYRQDYRKKYSQQNFVTNEVVAYEQKRATRVTEMVRRYFNKDTSKILDIGCSSGTLLKNLYKLSSHCELYGIEMNDNYRKFIVDSGIADQNNITNDNITMYCSGQKNKFDLITIVHVLEHLKNPKDVLVSIYRLLKDDGILYVEVPNLKTPYNNLREKYFAIYHLTYFTDFTLRKMLEKVGFKILEEKCMEKTSIAFVCVKDGSKSSLDDNSYDGGGEFLRLVVILRHYEKMYPLYVLKQYIIKVLIFLKIKDVIKKILKGTND